jgi:hypothetical protein
LPLSLPTSLWTSDTFKFARPSPRMLIRIVKTLPAPMMDGFDVSRFRVGQVYDAEPRLGRHLIGAGYAEPVPESASDR